MAKVLRLPLQTKRNRKKTLYSNVPLTPTILALVALCILSARDTSAYSYMQCQLDEFKCRDGSCILREKMCDGRPDCLDSSDEWGCDPNKCESPMWFACSTPNAPCLSAELVCNGIENCPGGEDERDCKNRKGKPKWADIGTGGWDTLHSNCSAYEYTCEMNKACIPLDFMCDGKRDCTDGSDEVAGCLKAEASCKGFFCANKKCLESGKWVCDGIDDCGDASDERNCTNACTADQGKFLCHNNSTCLDINKTCDGTQDCSDGSDELGRCSSTPNCSTKTCPTASQCRMFPESGPECICPHGYRYSTLQNACVDINECIEQYGLCSQRCINTAGSFKCECDENYKLLADNRTCETQGGQPLLLYTTQMAVMGVKLASNKVYTIASNLTKVIGVAFDGTNIFWTNIQNEGESIVKADADGSDQQILLTSGLDAPEDLAVDWLTGNIYFSDNAMRHIACCSNDGLHCVVLVTIDVHNPRGIALWPQRGQMFWTDWGAKPMIARASMNGNNSLPLVVNDIHWPNGIALDMHNDRLYWVDAKLSIIESVRPDGTDRRRVLDEVLKHPYGLAIFEDYIYWSDWGTKSVHTCHKFTGKDHRVIAKDRTIYAVHVYHSAKQPRSEHPCERARCSHLCLLAENNSFSCACPDGMVLASDQMHCLKAFKRQRLYIGIKSSLLEMEHTTFGRHAISKTHTLPLHVHQMTYNSFNGTIIIADNLQRALYEYNPGTEQYVLLTRGKIGNITALGFDYLAHNIYWADSERQVVEVLSLRNRQRAVICFFSGLEAPIGLSLVPEDGIMFVALRTTQNVHIDRYSLLGTDHRHAFEEDLGNRNVKLVVDYELKTLYWSDSALGRISFSDYRNLHAYTFRGRLQRPNSLAIVNDDLFWSELRSPAIHWTHKSNMGPVKTIEIELAKDAYAHSLPTQIPLLASSTGRSAGTTTTTIDHPCQRSNGGCSHLCVTVSKSAGACLCPPGLVFSDPTNRTCIDSEDCEFRCHSGECITQSRRCNGRKDCIDSSDEEGCDPARLRPSKVICTISQFMCLNGAQCIENERRCDGQRDCNDGSDEQHCASFDQAKQCHRHQHVCNNGKCVDFSVMCDGRDDCGDNSDETQCKEAQPNCGKDMFQCTTGTCIAKSWECDGKLDCSDASDEHDKCGLKDCPTNMHTCLLGQCIDTNLVCDGHNDCGDLSDELNCDYAIGRRRNVSCDSSIQYQCASDGSICLEKEARCNGTAECPRGEDEADCGTICGIYEFQCKTTKECIRLEFRCDHDKDCADGSDELNCAKGAASNVSASGMVAASLGERPCEPHMFDCKDGGCVDMSQVCDSFEHCDSGMDEGPMCKTACVSTTGRPVCEHKCRPTPSGASCSCFTGFQLDTDRSACRDIDECDEFNPCAQVCENTLGSYRCSCFPDFMLRTDKITCKSIESRSQLLFSTYNEVRSMSEHPISLRIAWATNDSKINGFDLHIRQRWAYFSTDDEDVLYQVHADNGTVSAALMVRNPTKVAVDWITSNVYVISRSTQFEIQVCSFAAQMCGRVVDANPREIIKTLTVDSLHRKLFYVTIRASTFGQSVSQITMAELDGKKRIVLINKKGGFISALAIDSYKKQLYYMDVHTKSLEMISYALGSSQTPMMLIQKSNLIIHPSGLSVYENQAFIVNIGSKEAVRCNLFGNRMCRAFNLNILNAEDIVVDGVTRQPLAKNPCAMAKCSGLCVQAEYGYECMCGNSIVDETVQCDPLTSNSIADSILLAKQADSMGHNTHWGRSLTVIFLVIVLAAGAAAGYWYYRRTNLGHRDLNINLHFQNPLATAGDTKTVSSRSSTIASFEFERGTDNAGGPGGENEREKLHFGLPLYRLFRGGPPADTSTGIMLEATKPSEVPTLAPPEPQQRIIDVVVEDDADYDGSGAGGHFNDDPHARLVP